MRNIIKCVLYVIPIKPIIAVMLILSIGCKEEPRLLTHEYETGTTTDIEGNQYKTVKIGTQWWMAENLKTTKLNDGLEIPIITDDSLWMNQNSPAYCIFDNNESYKESYGALYNWYIVDTEKLCPSGWHVPSDSEWMALHDYVADFGHLGNEGYALKAISGWNNTYGGIDKHGFSAIPGGYRSSEIGYFMELGDKGTWWSSTDVMWEVDGKEYPKAWTWSMRSTETIVQRRLYSIENGYSVRCVKD